MNIRFSISRFRIAVYCAFLVLLLVTLYHSLHIKEQIIWSYGQKLRNMDRDEGTVRGDKGLTAIGDDNSVSLGRESDEQILRDSINMYHVKYLEIPQNETCESRYPACILIGVPKGGTREMMDFLRLHPNIEIYYRLIGRKYEMEYFDRLYHKGEDWFKSEMPCSYSNQLTIMKNADYFFEPQVPGRLHKFNQNIKMILLIREPISRLVSHHMFAVQMRRDGTIADSDTLKNTILTGKGSALNLKKGIMSKSVYDEPMKLWLRYFNLNQFLIIDSQEFKTNPAEVLQKVEKFLGLESFIKSDMFVLDPEKGFFCVRSNLTHTGRACYPDYRGRKQIAVPPEVISKLREYFEPKTKRFFDIIGKSFDWY